MPRGKCWTNAALKAPKGPLQKKLLIHHKILFAALITQEVTKSWTKDMLPLVHSNTVSPFYIRVKVI